MADPIQNHAAPNQGMKNLRRRTSPAIENWFVSVQRQMKMEFPSQTTNSSYPFRLLPSQGNTGNRPKMTLPTTPKNMEILNDRAR